MINNPRNFKSLDIKKITDKEAAIDIVCGLTGLDDDSKTTFLALSWLIGVRKVCIQCAGEGFMKYFIDMVIDC
ncbi:hypothetical protein Tco_0079656 [Tanacetum coccineum]